MKASVSDPLVNSAVLPANHSTVKRYGFALAATLTAFFIRLASDPILMRNSNKLVFLNFIVAVIFVAWYSGFVPSLVSFVLGFLMAQWFFIEPRYSFVVPIPIFLNTELPSALVSMTIILFGRSTHLARDKANANAREAIYNQKKLEGEVVERQRAEDEIRRLNAELEQRVATRTAELVASNQELESFTYSVSHDLRAPLRHVDGYAQMLEEEFGPQLPPEVQSLAHKIRQGSQNMVRLVDDLLNLSSIGKKNLNRQRVDLNLVVESAVVEIKLEISNRQLEWRIGKLSVVDCDPGLVKQVFINLLANAVKYTRPRELAIIEIGEAKLNDETVIFVRDNGVGFNMKYAGKLFGVFQRLHRAQDFEGTGVGLAIVARIIRKHGGRIWGEAEVNKGATFFFTLPARQKVLPLAPSQTLAANS